MNTLSVSEARASLYRLIDEAAQSHKPVHILGKRNSAVLVSQQDWDCLQETLYLIAIPGMRESIREGIATPLQACSNELRW